MNELNILIGNWWTESDKQLFFQPTKEDKFTILPETTTWADIAVLLNLFPSRTQAIKNNYNKQIEEGFTDKRIGKLKKRVTIFKKTNWLDFRSVI